MALQVVTHLSGATAADGQIEPQWDPVNRACIELGLLTPEIRDVSAEAPASFQRAGGTLRTLAEQLDAFASECAAATAARDLARLQALDELLYEAAESMTDLGEDLPSDIECPTDVPDRPETCDA
jgi:hypothetical protein